MDTGNSGRFMEKELWEKNVHGQELGRIRLILIK